MLEWRDGALTALGRGGKEWRRTRFAPVEADVWRAVAGREQGEVLRVLRDGTGAPERLLFAGYAYTRDVRTFGELGQ